MYHPAAHINNQDQGLEALDTCRAQLGSDITADDVDSICKGYSNNPTIELTEEQARKTGLFTNSTFTRVEVPTHSLNIYCSIKHKKMSSGKVHSQYAMDDKRLFQAWEKAGFPTKWEPDKE
jgi:hypothetical protein